MQLYDSLKVHAMLEEIDGRDHTGRYGVGTPALFGMNFQSVNVAQKSSAGGYRDTQATPGAALLGAVEHVDRSIGRMMAELRRRGIATTTLVIVTAKHGNAPIDRTRLKIVSDAKQRPQRCCRRRLCQEPSAVQPPSTAIAWPLMKPLAAGSARKLTALAMSSGEAKRPMGTRSSISPSV